MTKIKINMFEVQLGSAMLLQFDCGDDGWVSVLADAGISASGYSLDHVHNKLKSSLQNNSENTIRIDLVIGTHYDKDHLAGLVPIIQDESIEIGEAWLPPVANDTELHAIDDLLDENDLLVTQFWEEDGINVLNRYLSKKNDICSETSGLIDKSSDGVEEYRSGREEYNNVLYDERDERDKREYIFQRYLISANGILKDKDCSHASDANMDFDDKKLYEGYFGDRWHHFPRSWFGDKLNREEIFLERWKYDSELLKRDRYSLASLQRSAAKDAINAISLYKVVTALKVRKIPIYCRIIQDGKPRHFVWNTLNKRFEAKGTSQNSYLPMLTLLGPSEGLVKKHWHRLPIGSYFAKIAYMDIPIRGITPSNQLSYVVRFEHEEQGILVVGDAGFVDFKPGPRKKYYQKLLDSLLPLHVIQVAHHGGRNAHFYLVLLKAGYASQQTNSFLMLSHETKDRYRPSSEFGLFVVNLRKDRDNVSLLFTSKPKSEKVHDYIDLIHPIVPSGAAPKDVGDVCIEYAGMQRWQVTKHSIKVV